MPGWADAWTDTQTFLGSLKPWMTGSCRLAGDGWAVDRLSWNCVRCPRGEIYGMGPAHCPCIVVISAYPVSLFPVNPLEGSRFSASTHLSLLLSPRVDLFSFSSSSSFCFSSSSPSSSSPSSSSSFSSSSSSLSPSSSCSGGSCSHSLTFRGRVSHRVHADSELAA